MDAARIWNHSHGLKKGKRIICAPQLELLTAASSMSAAISSG